MSAATFGLCHARCVARCKQVMSSEDVTVSLNSGVRARGVGECPYLGDRPAFRSP